MIGNAAGRCRERGLQRLIGRHFAARITPRDESALRVHLAGCAPCRARYERHLLLSGLVPGRPRMAERLAVGLGVETSLAAPASRSLSSGRRWVLATAAGACVALVIGGGAGRVDAPNVSESEFGARGSAPALSGPALEIYRVGADGSPAPAEGWMSARGELAFAYRNPTGFAWLMVFGVDDRGEVYWFHPAWTEASQDPVAVAVAAGEGPFELPEAIHHDVRGRRLQVVALFTDAAPSVRDIEERWRRGWPDPAGSVRIEAMLEVRP